MADLTFTDLVIVALAATRITRLATTDTIFDAPRLWLMRKGEWLEELLSCPWCTSVWVGLAVTADVAFAPRPWWWWPALVFATSQVAGMLLDR